MKRKIGIYRAALRENPRFMRFVSQCDWFEKKNDSLGNWMLGVSEKRETSFKDILDLFRNVLMVGAAFALFGEYARQQTTGAHRFSPLEAACGWALLIALGILLSGLLYQGAVVMTRLPVSGRWPAKIILALLWTVLAIAFFFMLVLALSRISGKL